MTTKRTTSKGAPSGAFMPPPRMVETWAWVCAAAAYDGGDAEPLANLLRTEPPPLEFRQMIADIVAGMRPLPRKGKANAKLPPSERLNIASALSAVRDICDTLRTEALDVQALARNEHSPERGAIMHGARMGIEPSEIVSMLHAARRKVTADAARSLGVSTETVENVLRDLQRRITRWPTV